MRTASLQAAINLNRQLTAAGKIKCSLDVNGARNLLFHHSFFLDVTPRLPMKHERKAYSSTRATPKIISNDTVLE
jgi:hypothetical protein